MTNPRLPPLLVNKVKRVPFFTCIPTKMFGQRSQAEQKRRVKKIGKVLGGQKDGVICFNGGFLQERPEFRNFLVERKGEEYICTPLNESGTTLTQPQ